MHAAAGLGEAIYPLILGPCVAMVMLCGLLYAFNAVPTHDASGLSPRHTLAATIVTVKTGMNTQHACVHRDADHDLTIIIIIIILGIFIIIILIIIIITAMPAQHIAMQAMPAQPWLCNHVLCRQWMHNSACTAHCCVSNACTANCCAGNECCAGKGCPATPAPHIAVQAMPAL